MDRICADHRLTKNLEEPIVSIHVNGNMPDVFTATIVMTAAAVALRPSRNAGAAVSVEGQFARSQVTQIWNKFEETISFQPPQSGLLSELENMASEHSLPGWDGNEAPAISYTALENARQFICALPSTMPPPELAVDPDDAAISFEWYGGHRSVFSVSVNESDRIACAGIDGVDQWYAALRFEGSLPALVTESVRRVTA